jgi:hypothetical protein
MVETLKWLVTEHFPEDGIEAWDDDNAGWLADRTTWNLFLSFAGMQLPIQVIKQRVLEGVGPRFVLEIGLPRETPQGKMMSGNDPIVVLIECGIWAVRPIEDQPEIYLTSWSIWEVGEGDRATRHFVGYNMSNREGRVSSEIIDFDAVALRGRTKSGRIYELTGSPGYDEDAGYVFGRWLRTMWDPIARDIT